MSIYHRPSSDIEGPKMVRTLNRLGNTEAPDIMVATLRDTIKKIVESITEGKIEVPLGRVDEAHTVLVPNRAGVAEVQFVSDTNATNKQALVENGLGKIFGSREPSQRGLEVLLHNPNHSFFSIEPIFDGDKAYIHASLVEPTPQRSELAVWHRSHTGQDVVTPEWVSEQDAIQMDLVWAPSIKIPPPLQELPEMVSFAEKRRVQISGAMTPTGSVH